MVSKKVVLFTSFFVIAACVVYQLVTTTGTLQHIQFQQNTILITEEKNIVSFQTFVDCYHHFIVNVT